jgi:CheY-like chemotaxis protein
MTRTALILEDEPILGFALEDMLIDLGFAETKLTTTLEEARDYLAGQAPEVAVLDVNIHGERSYGLAETLLERRIPFVFATGYGDAEHPPGLRHIPTLTKPYGLEDLRAALAATAPSS